MADSNQWELSKENIQPIKQGRKAVVLSTAIDETQQRKLNLQKQEFEKEIRIYSGNDPLSVWLKYALWIEQNYPKGGKDGNLVKLLESCFSSFSSSGESEKYRNDERFLDLWIKYINHCPCPLDLYQTLHTKNICTELPNFYENWAWEMERSGNIKKTNMIYAEGIQKTKNNENLANSYKKFQARVAKDMIEGTLTTVGENDENIGPQRTVLSALKTKGTKAKTPTERVSGVIGTAGKISVAKVEPKSNSLGPVFKIFQDENASQYGLSVNTNNIPCSDALPIKQSYAKENIKDPSKWSKNKLTQKSTHLVPIEDVDRYNKPTFVVHADDSSCNARSAPMKPEVNGILSIRKREEEEWQVPLFIQEPYNPLIQPQYDKNKVYCGTEEFSFEEIRAANLFKEEAELREKEDKLKMQDELNALKEMMKQQQELISNLMKKQTISTCSAAYSDENAGLNEENSRIPRVVISNPEKDKLFQKPDPRRIYEDSWVQHNKSTCNTENISQMLIHHDLQPEKQMISGQEFGNFVPPQEIEKDRGIGLNLNSSSLKEIGSPTINTKIANNLVNGFFNGSIFHKSLSEDLKFSFEDPFGSKKKDNTLTNQIRDENDAKSANSHQVPFEIFTDFQSQKCMTGSELPELAKPFQIYCDNRESIKMDNSNKRLQIFQDENQECLSNNAGRKKAARVPLTAISELPPVSKANSDEFRDENDENACPNGYQQVSEKRPLAGILKPSFNIPYIPLEEQEKMFGEDEEKKDTEAVDGIEPLELGEQLEDFTIKIPSDSEAFAKMACYASTPRPWCQGLVPQNSKTGDDYTMAFPIKTQQMESRNANFAADTAKKALPEMLNKHSDSVHVKDEKIIGDLMPPPNNSEKQESNSSAYNAQNDINMASTTPAATTMKLHLSPIMEASREYRSSSSSSSSSSCTLGGNSNYHGFSHLTHSAATTSRIMPFSRSRTVSGSTQGTMQNDSYGIMIHQNETSKSGYFADKSRGESISEAPTVKRTSIKAQSHHIDEKDHRNSFSPSKIAAKLLDMDPNLGNFEFNFGISDSYQTGKLRMEIADEVPKNVCESLMDVNNFNNINFPSNIDPFCKDLQQQLLLALKEPVEKRGGFVALNLKFPQVKPNTQVSLGKEMFRVKKMKGTGAYAQVFHSTTIDPLNVTMLPTTLDGDNSDTDADDESQMILKVQKPACYWEFYICHELRLRLKKMNYPSHIIDSFMRINRGYFFPNGSILVSQYHKQGTLLDFVNKIKETTGGLPSEYVVTFIMLQLIILLKTVHSCQIIHGDFKPDNIMITGAPDLADFSNTEKVLNDTPLMVKLIDFGRSIDMKMLPVGTTFLRKVETDGFTCCEMKDNRPWTYQTDLYGLAGIAHVLLFGTYMNVKKEGDKWKLAGITFQRRWNKELWHSFFDKMLNVPSCAEIPDLDQLLKQFKNYFDKHIPEVLLALKSVIPVIKCSK